MHAHPGRHPTRTCCPTGADAITVTHPSQRVLLQPQHVGKRRLHALASHAAACAHAPTSSTISHACQHPSAQSRCGGYWTARGQCQCGATRRASQYRPQRDHPNGDGSEAFEQDEGEEDETDPYQDESSRSRRPHDQWQQRGPQQHPMQHTQEPQLQRGSRPANPSSNMPPPGDQFAAFRAFQQLAALQDGGPRSMNGQRQGRTQPGGWDPRAGSGGGGGWPVDSRQGPVNHARASWDDGNTGTWQQQGPPTRWQQGSPGRGGGGGPAGAAAPWPNGPPRSEQVLPPGARLANFRRLAMTGLSKGWYAERNMTCTEVYEQIMRKAAKKEPAVGALFMLCRLATSAEDMRAGLTACVAVRGAMAAAGQERRPLGGPRLALAFVEACVRCDAPDVLVSAMLRANEAGLLLSYQAVHGALTHWATLQELHKVDQVLEAMPACGLPYTTKTAYVAIRGAVNGGRQDTAEAYAEKFTAAGVRLHNTTIQLLHLGRQRAKARAQALEAATSNGRQQQFQEMPEQN